MLENKYDIKIHVRRHECLKPLSHQRASLQRSQIVLKLQIAEVSAVQLPATLCTRFAIA